MLSEDGGLLERAFDIFNEVYFGSALPKVVITIQSSKKTYGHFTVNKIWSDEKQDYHEINISAEHLSRPIEHILATLMHEMCHLYAMVNEIQDTSKNGIYHNKVFREIAEERDLFIEYVKYYGYTMTSPTVNFIGVIKKYGLYVNIEHVRNSGSISPTDDGDEKPKKSSTRKYICPACGNSVRATKDLNIGCLDCSKVMIKVS